MKAKMEAASSSSRASGPASARLVLSAALAGALLAAIGSAALAASVKIEKPWMRFIIKIRPAAGYFTLHNGTDKAVSLTGASSSACGSAMLHQTKEVNGVAKMLPVKSIKVPAGGKLTFQPGGYHIMCMKPKMKIGDSVPVTLKFADGKTLTAKFTVTGPGGMKK
jgi:periplasmic copper chaperone A